MGLTKSLSVQVSLLYEDEDCTNHGDEDVDSNAMINGQMIFLFLFFLP